MLLEDDREPREKSIQSAVHDGDVDGEQEDNGLGDQKYYVFREIKQEQKRKRSERGLTPRCGDNGNMIMTSRSIYTHRKVC